MRIGVPRETAAGERRVALVPAVVRALAEKHSVQILVTTGAGVGAGHADEDYEDAGAEIVWQEEVWSANVILGVRAPDPATIDRYLVAPPGTEPKVFIGQLDPGTAADSNRALAAAAVTTIAVEAFPSLNGNRAADPASTDEGAASLAYAERLHALLDRILTDGELRPAPGGTNCGTTE